MKPTSPDHARAERAAADMGRTDSETARDPLLQWDLSASSPTDVWQLVAAELMAAAASARHPLHLSTLATVGPDGCPQARTVVLRHFDPITREVCFHSDLRSGKVLDILRERRVCLHWYDPDSRVQIRMPAQATVHQGDGRARAAWETAAAMSRACYAAADAPGTPLDSFPAAPSPPATGDDAGFEVFAAVSCHFDELDLLALHAPGHQRVRLDLRHEPARWQILAP
jgi:pyridoxamine 5'-phosphate oxidase